MVVCTLVLAVLWQSILYPGMWTLEVVVRWREVLPLTYMVSDSML